MKTRLTLLLAALVCSTARADDDNAFYFAETAVMPGGTTSIELHMRNTKADLTCLEAEIQLPDGLSAVLNEAGDPAVTLYRNRSAVHEVLSNVLENGNVKVLVSSIDGAVFRGTDGPILSICVQADEMAPTGECAVETVGESLLVTSDAEACYSVGVTGTVLITDDATAINEVSRTKDEELEGAPVYNLAGQRLAKKQSGINITGGRKELHR